MRESIFPVYSSREVLDFTYEAVERTAHIEGDLIECGVAAGSQLAMMAAANIDLKLNKKVIGYDSFEGIPFGIDKDKTQPGLGDIDKSMSGMLKTTGISSHSLSNVINNFEKFKVPMDNVTLVKGWFQNTMPKSNHKKISVLRLDGDLYDSTRVCLMHLLNKVSKGGIVIIDDWQLAGARAAVLEYVSLENIVEHLGIAYFVK